MIDDSLELAIPSRKKSSPPPDLASVLSDQSVSLVSLAACEPPLVPIFLHDCANFFLNNNFQPKLLSSLVCYSRHNNFVGLVTLSLPTGAFSVTPTES
ncbi:hypothetical protein PGT21_028542 [Puccinia graminis f. sp. tritici]|uniref:Uncharacterized protein n=1 Tax=Puccinia graminis f. sp. tritici TaxID=56615 RepID=A0A5B0M1D5_PUCGR|nr:hypothetical protein PGT21_028542 [Puccinia graminis f. sp. tritici]